MRMKIEDFDKQYFVCNFLQSEYLYMLIGNMTKETKEKIIDSFIRFLREKKTISDRTLEAMTGKIHRVLYREAMRSVESFLFFDNNDEEDVKNYVKKLTFDEYMEIVSDCLSHMRNQYIGKKSNMLKKGYCNFREIFFDRVYRAVNQMAYNIQYVKDADTVFKISYPDKVLKSTINRITRTTIATVLYDRGTNSIKSKTEDPKNLEFVKLDAKRMYNYVYTAQMENLPYNIEALLNAASIAFEFIINMELKDLDILNCPLEMKFYNANIKGISDEIVTRAHLDMAIEITNFAYKAPLMEERDKNSSPVGDNKVISGNEYDVLKDDGKTSEKEQVRPKYRKTYSEVNEIDDVDTSSDAELE